jgi:uncharacterized membrane protein YhaH (DUF805 family)
MQWMFLPLKRYAEFSGRSRRMEFWMWILFQLLLSLLFVILLVASVGMGALTGDPTQIMAGVGGALVIYALWLLLSLAFFIPNLAVTIRRLHDSNRSGHWVWLFWGPYLAMLAMALAGAGSEASGGILSLVCLAGGLALLVLMFFEGTKGANRYGPDPKGEVSSEVFA